MSKQGLGRKHRTSRPRYLGGGMSQARLWWAEDDVSVGPPVASPSGVAYAEEVNFESCALFVDRNQLSHLPLSNWCVFSQILRARAWVSCFAMIDVFLIFVSILSRLGYWGLLLIFGPVNAHRFTGQP